MNVPSRFETLTSVHEPLPLHVECVGVNGASKGFFDELLLVEREIDQQVTWRKRRAVGIPNSRVRSEKQTDSGVAVLELLTNFVTIRIKLDESSFEVFWVIDAHGGTALLKDVLEKLHLKTICKTPPPPPPVERSLHERRTSQR